MFSRTVIESDRFLDLSHPAKTLYFYFCMQADDDGFVDNPKVIMRMTNSTQKDLDTLIQNGFIIREDRIYVVTHWNIHNHIQKDRYKQTIYQAEFQKLILLDNKTYSMRADRASKMDTNCIQNVSNTDTQNRIDKNSQEQNSIEKEVSLQHPVAKEKDFEMLWSMYPRKEGKKEAFEGFKRGIKEGVSVDLMKQKIEEYNQYIKVQQKEHQYIKSGKSWFKGKGWLDDYDLTPITKSEKNTSQGNDYSQRTDDFNDDVLMDL